VISHPFTGSDILAFRVFFAHVLLGLLATSAWAEVRYIDDTLLVPLRRGESSQHRIIHRGLPSGTKLELLGENTETGYAHVRTPGGTEGYVPVQYLRKTPIARDQLAEAQKTIAALTSKSKPVQAQLLELREQNKSLTQQLQSAESEKNRLTNRLTEIESVSANAISINQTNKTLLKENSVLKNKIDVAEAEKKRLQERSDQEWFLNGAGAVGFGVLLALLIPRLTPKKRRSEWS
jgi:SH3 domain protein